ncbi:hypothetical protein [Nocardioides anomalus]|uniref:hypothetical protein n=1 Tax=Nocardioides anomalus TaxID=2712223 RepID=UPI0018AD57DA|nr:hypothetical protein [Nocardioides anomalus]
MTSTLTRGLAAGAVGTALLDAATYADLLLTGRPASDAPGRTVLGLAQARGLDLPDDDSRLAAYGQLGGLAAGLAVGVAASVARRAGVRLPAPLSIGATAAAAMAATDLPMARAGVSDPRTWSAQDWVRDALPHLAFGAGVHYTVSRVPVATAEREKGLLWRSTALGVAAGARASLGAVAFSRAAGWGTKATAALSLGELLADKLPQAPSRLQPGSQAGRLASGAVGAAALARRSGSSPWLPAAFGALGAGVGTIAGAAWREAAQQRGWTWQAALAEDGVALGLVAVAVRQRR